MSFNHVKKVGDKYYLYRVTGKWDPVKKNSVNTREYIGPCDAEGNIQNERRNDTVSVSKTFGPYWLMKTIAELEGVDTRLRDAFGDELGNDILLISLLRSVRPVPLRDIRDQAEESFLSDMEEFNAGLGSRDLSRLLTEIAGFEERKERFFSSMCDGSGAVIFDITSFGSGSTKMERPEYGDDYGKIGVPQVNFGMVQSMRTGLPFCYRRHPGSMNDMRTLTLMQEYVRSLGCTDAHFVMDRGFFSESSLTELMDKETGFTTPVPGDQKIFTSIVSGSMQNMSSVNTLMLGGSVYRIHETETKVGSRTIRAVAYIDEDRRNDEITTLYSKIIDFESVMKMTKWHNGVHRSVVKEGEKEMLRYFDLSENKDGTVRTERKRNAITRQENLCGRMVLLTTSEKTAAELLEMYQDRSDIESSYKVLKNDLDGGAKGLRTDMSSDGMIFIQFVSLILRSSLLRRLKPSDMYGKVWITDIMGEMNKLKTSRIGGQWVLNEVTEKQRAIFKALDFKEPDTATVRCLVTKK
ncbi:MAG: transposase [Candidatus Methanoplasma sp.]|nr:transposase [Candidatus Methanoplasma sp.]